MPSGLNDLDPDARQRLIGAFTSARTIWGPRAKFARAVNVETSSVQILEGKRVGTISDDMIERLTVGVGWPQGHWRTVAAGELSVVDGGESDLEALVRQLAQRVAELERTLDSRIQSDEGEHSQDDPGLNGA